jgi:arginyl-tRNA synthetase
MTIREILKEEIGIAVKKLFGKEASFNLARDERFADYATNVALVTRVGNPRETAEKLIADLKLSPRWQELVTKTEIAGPGFINIWLTEKAWELGIENIGMKPKRRKEKIQLEFISANPTGKLHVGHARGAFYGDVLARVLLATGHNLTREFYVNDSKESTQIKELGKTALGEGTSYLTDYLKGKIKKYSARLKKMKSRKDDAKFNLYGEAGHLLSLEIQKDNQRFIERDLGVKFDRWFSEEQNLRSKGIFEKTLAMLTERGMVYERDGAQWLKTSEYDDDEDRVVVRSDGAYSYFLADIAYHNNKFARKFARVIDIWGADHQGHVKRMMAVKKMLEITSDLDILISQLVTIKEGEQRRKLSKRQGTIIYLEDLVRVAGIDAVRWFYIEKSLDTHMEFDIEMARKRTPDNPVYYAQYAHARMASILKKAGKKTKVKKINIAKMADPAEHALIKKLTQFSEVLEDVVADHGVHHLTTYAYELARQFSAFYRDARVLGAGKDEAPRLALVALTKDALARTLGLLGISTPNKM